MKVLRIGLLRLAAILRVLARHGVARLLGARAASWPWLAHRLPMASLPAPERLRMLFEDLGGTFIKFGQMLAMQPDILSVEHCNALFKLLDQVDPFPYSEVERIVTEELGRGPEEIFDAFEEEPIATASVGQVHVAWLGGEKVAVKVQRPNVEIEFWSDIRLMIVTMRTIRWLHLRPLYWMIEPMSEFVDWTREELDYRHEAGYSERLRGFARDMPGQDVPRVRGEYTTRRTLVVDFLEGVTVLDFLRARERGDEVLMRRLEQHGFSRRRFASHVIDNFLGNAFRHGIYHADLHPANLMILRDSVVGYIDFGITGVMNPYARSHLVKMTLALANGDMELLHREFLQVSVWGEGSAIAAFRRGLDRLAEGWYVEEGNGQRLKASFTRIMSEMLRLSRATDVMPERDIIKYIRSSIAIDGLVTRLEIDFHLGEYLGTACTRYIRWFDRANRFSADRMLDWASASGRLWADGAQRGVRLLDRLAAGIRPAAGGAVAQEADALRTRALQLAAAAFGAAVLVAAGPDGVRPGINLWTAELVFVGAALTGLTATLRRLVW